MKCAATRRPHSSEGRTCQVCRKCACGAYLGAASGMLSGQTPDSPGAENVVLTSRPIGDQVGHDDLVTTARTHTHVVADERGLSYGDLLSSRRECTPRRPAVSGRAGGSLRLLTEKTHDNRPKRTQRLALKLFERRTTRGRPRGRSPSRTAAKPSGKCGNLRLRRSRFPRARVRAAQYAPSELPPNRSLE